MSDPSEFVSLEAVAECYAVERTWVVEVYRAGLLGEGREESGTVSVSVQVLDRVAEIRRLHAHLGLELEIVAAWLERAP